MLLERPRLDDGGLGPDRSDPLPDGLGDERRAGVGSAGGRDAAHDAQVGQHIDDLGRGTPPPNPDRQTLASARVEDMACARGPAVVGPVINEVIGPDVVWPLGA